MWIAQAIGIEALVGLTLAEAEAYITLSIGVPVQCEDQPHFVDFLCCPVCHDPMRVIAVIDDPLLVQEILRRLGAWHAPPARGSPQGASGPYSYEPCDDVDPRPRTTRTCSRAETHPHDARPECRSASLRTAASGLGQGPEGPDDQLLALNAAPQRRGGPRKMPPFECPKLVVCRKYW